MEINLKSALMVTTESGKKAITEAWETLRLMGQVPDNAVVVSRALLAEAEGVLQGLFSELRPGSPLQTAHPLRKDVKALLPRIRAALKSE